MGLQTNGMGHAGKAVHIKGWQLPGRCQLECGDAAADPLALSKKAQDLAGGRIQKAWAMLGMLCFSRDGRCQAVASLNVVMQQHIPWHSAKRPSIEQGAVYKKHGPCWESLCFSREGSCQAVASLNVVMQQHNPWNSAKWPSTEQGAAYKKHGPCWESCAFPGKAAARPLPA
jgi:hypothetical protein